MNRERSERRPRNPGRVLFYGEHRTVVHGPGLNECEPTRFRRANGRRRRRRRTCVVAATDLDRATRYSPVLRAKLQGAETMTSHQAEQVAAVGTQAPQDRASRRSFLRRSAVSTAAVPGIMLALAGDGQAARPGNRRLPDLFPG